ncbi:MAG: hypothetical protein ACHQ4G_03900 [Opitutales bacterium]
MADRPMDFLQSITEWIVAESSIRSAVLFGSSARAVTGSGSADHWSDLDLHLVASDPAGLERVDWRGLFPDLGFALQSVRPATGGVRKVTVLFQAGQLDLVIVPLGSMHLARAGFAFGARRWSGRLRHALDEISTCLRGGYRFLKGERDWGAFYAKVSERLPGTRLTDADLVSLANISVVDQLWILQKIRRGELCAAQHQLHRSVGETNFRLLRERRLRRGQSLPSFGLARHAEELLDPVELSWVKIDSACDAAGLADATWQAQAGLRALMGDLVPTWQLPAAVVALLQSAKSGR